MILKALNAGDFKLDGGAMFGVVPKSIWEKFNPSDENNLCTWATRCLFISTGDKKILIDTGIGDKQPESFFKHYYRSNSKSWNESLSTIQESPESITDVLLTHLHFDHVGGATYMNGDKVIPTFPNATYWVHSQQWNWAIHPNPREKASFLKENLLPLQNSGQLKFLDIELPDWKFMEMITVDGHTEKQLLPLIHTESGSLLFAADLIPSHGHIALPYVMSYDVRPLLTMEEKESILTMALEQQWILFFEHDPTIECCTLQKTDKGIRPKELFQLEKWYSKS
jgi:glyoxylase-like metal-dependent hydrolase (beta-lactamase superfamily II)